MKRLPTSLALLLLVACSHRGVTPIRTHFNKGVYHYSAGDYGAAASEYRLALEEEPLDHRARFNLSEALEAQADRLAAAGQTEAAEALRRDAEAHYRTLLAERPFDLRASVNLAALELDRGDAAAAEARLVGMLERHPASALPRLALAAHRLRRAGTEPNPRQLHAAAELLAEALRRDPASVDATMLLGHTLAALAKSEAGSEAASGFVERAREAFKKGLDSDGSDLATLLALARLELEDGRPGAAAEWLRRALYVDSELLEAHHLLSEALAREGDLEGATLHLWRGRQLEDERWPTRSEEEYSRRLLDLYRRLGEQER